MNKKIQSTIFLTLTAMIWGFAFVAQRSGMEHIGPFLFSGLRMLIGSLALIPIILITERFSKRNKEPEKLNIESENENSKLNIESVDINSKLKSESVDINSKLKSDSDINSKLKSELEYDLKLKNNIEYVDSKMNSVASKAVNMDSANPITSEDAELNMQQDRRYLFQGGIACGLVVFFAANFQQVGLVFTTAAKTGFITTLYIVLVPLSGLFLKHKVGLNAWIGVIIATFGLYFLCITEKLTISFGDFVVLIGAGFWAAHILCMDYYAPKVSVPKLICVQFIVSGVLSLVISIFREEITWNAIIQAAPALLYVGIFSSAIAFTFQGLGQKHASPTAASIILSTEAVFGALGGVLVLNEMLSTREWLGCVLMFIAVIITQLPSRPSK